MVKSAAEDVTVVGNILDCAAVECAASLNACFDDIDWPAHEMTPKARLLSGLSVVSVNHS